MESSIRSLSQVHERLADLFQMHQEALLDGDLTRAGELLREFGTRIRAHIRHEEDVLMPVYRERVDYGRLGDPAHLLDEHRQIQEQLEQLQQRVAALRSDDSRLSRELVALVEEEWRFKQLLEHHNQREDRTFYPCLDEKTSPEERAVLLQDAGLTEEKAR